MFKPGKAAAFLGVIVAVVAWAAAAAAETATFRDKLGRQVSVSVPVRRAVLFETYEPAAALGVWDRIAGISRHAYTNDLILALKPDIAKAIPSAGSGADINMEALLRLRPDIVITWSYKPETIRFLEARGLKVIALYPESLAELYETMRLQGRLFGREKRMDACIARMEIIFGLISERCRTVPAAERKRVIWLGGRQTAVSGGIGINNDLIGLMNAVNPAAAYRQRSIEISMERITAWSPEAIFIWGNAKYGPDDLLGSARWRHIAAIRRGRLYKAPTWSTWSPRLAVTALWMAMKTYPERFRDVDFERTADDFYRAVYGIPYGRVNRIE